MKKQRRSLSLLCFALLLLLSVLALACGGVPSSIRNTSLATSVATFDICSCQPRESAADDYRHAAKHIPLPDGVPQEITAGDVLAWPLGDTPAFEAPRAGRELVLFEIERAFLQAADIEPLDCDLKVEISAVSDKNAPRVITEIPIEPEHCPARRNVQLLLAEHGLTLTNTEGGELAIPLPVDVIGLAFRDHADPDRGSARVGTLWELHPAALHASEPPVQ